MPCCLRLHRLRLHHHLLRLHLLHLQGPKWKRTLLFVAYDDAGGYYDHVVPPYEGVPADESPCIVPGLHPECGQVFDFRRLGLRTTSMLISPWVAKGTVFQERGGRRHVAVRGRRSRHD